MTLEYLEALRDVSIRAKNLSIACDDEANEKIAATEEFRRLAQAQLVLAIAKLEDLDVTHD